MIRWLTFLMFLMFAMTTDSVGVIIPKVIDEFHLSLTQASAFHYTTMAAIALSGILLGFLADRLGRRAAIGLGLGLYAAASFLFIAGHSFAFFLCLLALSGAAIGVFKTGALALIGDISRSTAEHTTTMNTVEGFFGVGAIIGPAIVALLVGAGLSWKWLYVIAGAMCIVLLIAAAFVNSPSTMKKAGEPIDLRRTLRMMRDPYAIAFSLGAFLYVATECAIYVWMPTLLKGYAGSAALVAAYAIPIFFAFRAFGRFMGAWVLARWSWAWVLSLFSLCIFLCFAGTAMGGVAAGVWLLPLSGLFMSMIYPTINSKGISSFPKAEHGAVAGVILFFTCAAAALGPLLMGVVSDRMGDIRWGFFLATGFSGLLFLGLLMNLIFQPAREHLRRLDRSEYGEGAGAPEASS